VTVAKTPETADAHETSTANADIAALSFEQARDELVRVVAELEQGSSTLEQSLALWERGEALAQRCEEWLVGARARLDAARSAAGSAGQSVAGQAAAGLSN
jgi:exodeoxyribonuclease VII small subunit